MSLSVPAASFFAGIDWAAETHAVCVLDSSGHVKAQFTIAHSADVESPIALNFLARYPTAASAARLGEKQMAAFCARHAYSGRRPAAELVARLRAAPAGTTDQALTQAAGDAVLAMVAVLRALASSTKALTRSVTMRL